jgi:hypothetical protein
LASSWLYKGRNNFPSFLFFFFYLKAMNSFASGQEENGVGNFFCSAPRHCMADWRRMRGKNGGRRLAKTNSLLIHSVFHVLAPFFFSSTGFFINQFVGHEIKGFNVRRSFRLRPPFRLESPDRPFEDANHRPAGDELSPKTDDGRFCWR